MRDTRKPRQRLDALLTRLEDEVLRTEGEVATDVQVIRSRLESLIESHTGVIERHELPREEADPKGTMASAVEWLARWTAVGRVASSPPMRRVRMAFSGKREPPGSKTPRGATQARRDSKGKSDDKQS